MGSVSKGHPMNPPRNRLEVPGSLKQKMLEAARDFRKSPTPSEALLWQALRGKQLNHIKFRRQQPIGPFVVDFYAPSARLVIEIDGAVHQQQPEADQTRQRVLESLDLNILRFSAGQVERDIDSVLSAINLKVEEILLAMRKESPESSESPLSVHRRGAGGEVPEVSEVPHHE